MNTNWKHYLQIQNTRKILSVKIAPSLLAADFSQLGAQVKMVEDAGIDMHHLDVMDGRFVPNISYGPLVVDAVRRVTEKPLDVHLMIVEPEKYIEQFRDAGADWITVHLEAVEGRESKVLEQIRKTGAKAGISINPDTPAEALIPFLSDTDLVLIMSVHPGFGGQKFIEGALEKVETIHKLRLENDYKLLISIDGGVGLNNAQRIVDAGADILVAGSSIYLAEDPPAVVRTLKNLIPAK